MTDVLTPEQRRLNMSRVRSRNTRPEMLVRRGLHALGYRFRLHRRDLPGRPDLVLPSHRVALFVHGCFWHGHDCELFRLPATRSEFWARKISGNKARDQKALLELAARGWRTMIVWECAIRGGARRPVDHVILEIDRFIRTPAQETEIAGKAKIMSEGLT